MEHEKAAVKNSNKILIKNRFYYKLLIFGKEYEISFFKNRFPLKKYTPTIKGYGV